MPEHLARFQCFDGLYEGVIGQKAVNNPEGILLSGQRGKFLLKIGEGFKPKRCSIESSGPFFSDGKDSHAQISDGSCIGKRKKLLMGFRVLSKKYAHRGKNKKVVRTNARRLQLLMSIRNYLLFLYFLLNCSTLPAVSKKIFLPV